MIVPPLIGAYLAKLDGCEARFVWCHIMLMGMCALQHVFYTTVCTIQYNIFLLQLQTDRCKGDI